jgi:hypothetical protein
MDELKQGTEGTVQDMFWPPLLNAQPRIITKAAEMDLALWPYDEKTMDGRKKNQVVSVDYTPDALLRGNTSRFKVEPGLGLAGAQGYLQLMQLYGAEIISEEDVAEQLPGVHDSQQHLRRLAAGRLKKVLQAQMEQFAIQGLLAPGAIHKLLELIEDKGKTYPEAVRILEERGELMMPPPEPPPGMEGAAGPGGPPGAGPIPPELVEMMGGAMEGGAVPGGGGGLPPLEELRGA